MSTSSKCVPCEFELSELLKPIPAPFRKAIAKILCKIRGEKYEPSCTDFKNCETLTTLSPFTIVGTNVCITFKDEKGVFTQRCADLQSILNAYCSTPCVRPSGLTKGIFASQYGIPGSEIIISGMNAADACDEWSNFNQWTMGFGGPQAEFASLAIGQTVYHGHDGTACNVVPEGNYWYFDESGSNPEDPNIKVITVDSAGTITAITECNTTRITSTTTTTTV